MYEVTEKDKAAIEFLEQTESGKFIAGHLFNMLQENLTPETWPHVRHLIEQAENPDKLLFVIKSLDNIKHPDFD